MYLQIYLVPEWSWTMTMLFLCLGNWWFSSLGYKSLPNPVLIKISLISCQIPPLKAMPKLVRTIGKLYKCILHFTYEWSVCMECPFPSLCGSCSFVIFYSINQHLHWIIFCLYQTKVLFCTMSWSQYLSPGSI